VREFYGLEKLWEDTAPLEAAAAVAAPRRKTAGKARAAR
jgi:hypothetical protein